MLPECSGLDRSGGRSRSPRRGGSREGEQNGRVLATAVPLPTDIEFWPGISDRRFEGTVLSVHPERTCGFIQCPPQLRDVFGNRDIFVTRAMMSNFHAGDVVSFGVDVYRDGKPQAKELRPAGVHRAAAAPAPAATRAVPSSMDASALAQSLTTLAVALAPVVNAAGQMRNTGGAASANNLAASLAVALQASAPQPLASPGAIVAAPPPLPPSAGVELDTTYDIEVPFEQVGALVGRRGASIRELEKKAGGGVRVQVLPPDSHGGPQVAQVTGPSSAAAYAADLVRQKLEEIKQSRIAFDMARSGLQPEEVEPAERPECVHEVEVAPDIIGALIGKHGACIQELQRRAGGGVHIQVQPPEAPGGSQLVQVTGTTAGADMGRELVLKKISEIMSQRAFFESSRPAGLATEAPAFTDIPHDTWAAARPETPAPEATPSTEPIHDSWAATDSTPPAPSGDVTHEVEVPPDFVGALIGKHGSSIHDLERRAGGGVRVQIPPAAAPGGRQVARIIGPAAAASLGRALVEQRLEEIRSERSVHDHMRAVPERSSGAGPAPHVSALADSLRAILERPGGRGQGGAAHTGSGTGVVVGGARPVTTLGTIPGGSTGDVTYELPLPTELVGSLIGRQGSSIHELERRAGGGVRIQVPAAPAGKAVAKVIGPPREAALGKALVQQRVDEIRRERLAYEGSGSGSSSSSSSPAQASLYSLAGGIRTIVPATAGVAPQSMSPPPAGLLGVGRAAATLPTESVEEVPVPVELVGALIGRQGACIGELQLRAGVGVHIQVQPPRGPSGQQLARVSGPAPGVTMGCRLVREKIEELRRERVLHEQLRGSGAVARGSSATGVVLPSQRGPLPAQPAATQDALLSVATALLGAVLQSALPARRHSPGRRL